MKSILMFLLFAVLLMGTLLRAPACAGVAADTDPVLNAVQGKAYLIDPLPPRIQPYAAVYKKIAHYRVMQHGEEIVVVVLAHIRQPGQMAWAIYQFSEPTKNSSPVLTLKQFMILNRQEMRVEIIFIKDSI